MATQVTLNSGSVDSAGSLALKTNGTTTAVTINASQGVEFNAGAVGTPSITTTGDTNTGIFFPAADTIAFSEGGVESMRITSAGNVGIGITSPDGRLHVHNGTAGSVTPQANADDLTVENNANAGISILSPDANVASIYFGSPASAFNAQIESGYNAGAPYLKFNTSAAERMRIDSAGNMGLGVTPSAWTSFSAFQFGENGSLAANDFGADNAQVILGNNTFYDGAYKYIATGDSATRYSQAAGAHSWSTAASGTAGNTISFTQAMTLNASGNLGIGTTTPFAKLSAEQAGGNLITARYNSSNAPIGVFIGGSSGAGFFGSNLTWSSGNTFNYAISSLPTYWIGNPAGQAALIFGYGSGTAGTDALTSTERMRIDSSGNLLVGTQSVLINSARRGISVATPTGTFVAGSFKNEGGASAQTIDVWNAVTSGNANFISFFTEGSPTDRGGLYYDRAANQTKLAATSDQRLKENIVDAPAALPVVAQIKVRQYDWKETGSTNIGFVAQELHQVVERAVAVGEDNEDGSIKRPWGVDNATLVPYLVKAIQEQQAIITQLQADVAALKGTA
jgi:hypothetical protein